MLIKDFCIINTFFRVNNTSKSISNTFSIIHSVLIRKFYLKKKKFKKLKFILEILEIKGLYNKIVIVL